MSKDRELLRKALSFIPDGFIDCRGDKCRQSNCTACCGDMATSNDDLIARITASLSEPAEDVVAVPNDDVARMDWLCKQSVTVKNQSLLLVNPPDLRAVIDIELDETEDYVCQIHGKQDGPDCARC